jgi:hypothetical protein
MTNILQRDTTQQSLLDDEAWEQTLRDYGSISGPPRAIFNIGWGACRTANSIELDRLRAENATLSESVTSQALLIASLKEERDRFSVLLDVGDKVQELAQRVNDDLSQQLSDTHRQNAELMQRVGEADKDAERYRWLRDDTVAWQESDARVALIADEWGWRMDRVIDAAIAASKVSNEVASPRKDETIAYKGDE